MTCSSRCYDDSDATDYSYQNSDTDMQPHYNDEVVSNQQNESLCGILELPTHPKRIFEDFVPLPELLLFIQKVTTKARIDVRTIIIALILVLRFKRKIQNKLPKNKIQGEYVSWLLIDRPDDSDGSDSPIKFVDLLVQRISTNICYTFSRLLTGTCHKIFLSAIIVALKFSFGTFPYNSTSPSTSEEELPLPKSPCDEIPINEQENLSETNNPMILSTTPSSVSSNASLDYDELASQQFNNHEHSLNSINQRIAESSGIFSINEINKAEKSFLKILGKFQVSDENVRDFIESNRQALGIW
ncbi:17900_t:CDS:2 [Dentiscutata erythropus]|uniref:17900_t:CDS:1 n=1 Tax=Dentiscutata erythropus TaxID=1348616 RepID=A0A9N8WJJ9_9GLOM|nr:17900_t:CDS:2 [Dentiscutata erythropus]